VVSPWYVISLMFISFVNSTTYDAMQCSISTNDWLCKQFMSAVNEHQDQWGMQHIKNQFWKSVHSNLKYTESSECRYFMTVTKNMLSTSHSPLLN
jgi:hypothetical protein